MAKYIFRLAAFFAFGSVAIVGQTPADSPSDPMANIAVELTRVRAAVTSLSKSMIDFVDKFEKVGGITINEKQQKLVMAMEVLQRAEARLAGLQQAQVLQVEKLNETRAKLAQNEIDSRPRNIDRSFAMEGTTELVELRENKIAKLQAERVNLTALARQLESNLAETNEAVRDAQLMVNRLRKQYLPQVERELLEQ
jgi:hypothetical protein